MKEKIKTFLNGFIVPGAYWISLMYLWYMIGKQSGQLEILNQVAEKVIWNGGK